MDNSAARSMWMDRHTNTPNASMTDQMPPDQFTNQTAKQVDDLRRQIDEIEKTRTRRQMENKVLLAELKRVVNDTKKRIDAIGSEEASLRKQEEETIRITQTKLNDLLGTSAPIPSTTALARSPFAMLHSTTSCVLPQTAQTAQTAQTTQSARPTSSVSLTTTSRSRLRDEDDFEADFKSEIRSDPRTDHRADHRVDCRADSRVGARSEPKYEQHSQTAQTKSAQQNATQSNAVQTNPAQGNSTRFSAREKRKMMIDTLRALHHKILNAYISDGDVSLSGAWHPTFTTDAYPQFREIEDIYRETIGFLRSNPCGDNDSRIKRTAYMVSKSITLQGIIAKYNARSTESRHFKLEHALVLDEKYFPSQYIRDSWWHKNQRAYISRILPAAPYDEQSDFEVISTHGLLTCQVVRMNRLRLD